MNPGPPGPMMGQRPQGPMSSQMGPPGPMGSQGMPGQGKCTEWRICNTNLIRWTLSVNTSAG